MCCCWIFTQNILQFSYHHGTMSQSKRTYSLHDRAAKHYQLALQCIDDNNFGLALGNLLLVVKLCPDQVAELQQTVAICLDNATQCLENAGRHQELLKIFESVLEALPECGQIINSLGDYLLRHGHVLQAAAHFLRATRADRRLVAARDNLDRANARLVDRWHFTMLNDARRNAAFGRAVRAAAGRLAEGDLVLDVGAGTALLSMMAARAGASPVYACESSEAMCQVAAATLADNAMENRVHLINQWSHQLAVGDQLPRRAALLVTETFDAGLLGEHVLATLRHAWRHLLLPPGRGAGHGRVLPGRGAGHGRVLPAAAAVWAAAVQSVELRRQLTARLPSGARLRRRLTEPYWSERLADAPGGYTLLSEPVQVYTVDFNDPESIERGLAGLQGRHVTRCTADGRLDALVTWFELQLGEGDGEVLSSAPAEGSCWEQAVYPVPAGRSVRCGQTLRLRSVCRGHLELRLDDGPAEGAADASQTAEPAETMETTETTGIMETTGTTETTRTADEGGSLPVGGGNLTEATQPSESAESTPAAAADVADTDDAEEVISDALAFVNDGRQVSALGAVLRSWQSGRPVAPPPRLLDLCPAPLSRLTDLAGAAVSRRDAGSGREAAAGCWDAVLCAPVLPSGRLDPVVMRAVQSISLSEGGLLAPSQLQLMAVAVTSRLLLHMTSVLGQNTDGLDCSAINVFRVHQLQDFPYSQQSVSSDLTDIHTIGCLDVATGSFEPQQFAIPVTSTGEMHGLVYWFRPVDGSAGEAARPQSGRQMAAVLPAPRAVRPGQSVAGAVHPTADGVLVVLDE